MRRTKALILAAAAFGFAGLTACSSSYGESRYGEYSYEYGYGQNSQGANCGQALPACGYYIMPTYQVAQMPPPAQPLPPSIPEVPYEPPVTVCPDGQYRMDDGTCAVMITEKPPQYEPPVYVPPVTYPPVPPTPPEVYIPIRK